MENVMPAILHATATRLPDTLLSAMLTPMSAHVPASPEPTLIRGADTGDTPQ
jgi:hypothetical protein